MIDVSAQALDLDGIRAPLSINGGGTAPLVLYDQDNSNILGIHYAIDGDTLSRQSDQVVGIGLTPSITFTHLTGLELDRGAFPFPIAIGSTPASMPVTIKGGTGGDAFIVAGDSTLDGAIGPVNIEGSSGINTLELGGDGDAPLFVNVPDASTPGSGTITASYPATGPTRTITYSDMSKVVGTTSVQLHLLH